MALSAAMLSQRQTICHSRHPTQVASHPLLSTLHQSTSIKPVTHHLPSLPIPHRCPASHHKISFSRPLTCVSLASSAALSISQTDGTNSHSPSTSAIQAVLSKCRTLFCCIAFCAVWAWLSAPSSSNLLASLSLSGSSTTAQGAQLAAKSAWAGLAAGFLHTLCGPDHLAALTPLTIGRNRFSASALGALWGFGHSTGQLILGLVFVLLKERFHDFVPLLSQWAGTIVALTLIAIGCMGIYETYIEGGHHEAEVEEAGLQLAVAGGGSGGSVKAAAKAGWATYATGILYGLQPDALFVVIPALALPTKLAAIAYCSMFVIGTVTAMGGYTLLIGTTSQALIKEQPWLQKHLSTIASGIAIIVGVLLLLSGWGLEVPFFGGH